LDLSGRTAVVTGGASGIGKATALRFGRAGADVALLDIDVEGASQVAHQIDPTGSRTIVCQVDMAQPAAVRTALGAVDERFGRLDAVANVAAIYPRAKAQDVTQELWDRILSIDLRGVFFCCQEAIRIMCERGGGVIVNVASGAAFRPVDGQAAYSAAKAGLVGMSRVLALEYARQGIRVNVVAPGHTLTEGSVAFTTEDQINAMAETLVPGRFMTPAEPANAIVWLCSSWASGLNGAIVNVNGGNHMPQG
jgi:NAD(P)-dependent dehydrogenase (short-subunit alcohol dehydrogenase family)